MAKVQTKHYKDVNEEFNNYYRKIIGDIYSDIPIHIYRHLKYNTSAYYMLRHWGLKKHNITT